MVLTDADAARACCRFADDERLLVELACGASIAVCYDGRLRNILPHLTPESKVVIVVCGGSNISLGTLVDYRQKFGGGDEVVAKDTKCSVPSALTIAANSEGHVKGAEVVDMEEMMRTCEGAAAEHLPDMATMMQVAREFDDG